MQLALLGAEADPEPAKTPVAIKAMPHTENRLCRMTTPLRWCSMIALCDSFRQARPSSRATTGAAKPLAARSARTRAGLDAAELRGVLINERSRQREVLSNGANVDPAGRFGSIEEGHLKRADERTKTGGRHLKTGRTMSSLLPQTWTQSTSVFSSSGVEAFVPEVQPPIHICRIMNSSWSVEAYAGVRATSASSRYQITSVSVQRTL